MFCVFCIFCIFCIFYIFCKICIFYIFCIFGTPRSRLLGPPYPSTSWLDVSICLCYRSTLAICQASPERNGPCTGGLSTPRARIGGSPRRRFALKGAYTCKGPTRVIYKKTKIQKYHNYKNSKNYKK